MKTVEEYRKSGYKVRVEHFRPRKNSGQFVRYSRKTKTESVMPNGGVTNVTVTAPTGYEFVGSAACSTEDPFNYSLGVRIALGRAMNH